MSSSDATASQVRTGPEVESDRGGEPTFEREGHVAALESELTRLRGQNTALREQVATREARIEELEQTLDEVTRRLENAEQWGQFLDRELTERRETIQRLEARIETLEANDSEPSGLLDRLRALF